MPQTCAMRPLHRSVQHDRQTASDFVGVSSFIPNGGDCSGHGCQIEPGKSSSVISQSFQSLLTNYLLLRSTFFAIV